MATGGAVRFPRAVQELLQRGLAARDRYFAEELIAIGLKRIATGLTRELGDLVHPVKSHADNERFAKFLENHLDEVFPFLRNPDLVSATNNECESELRYNVITKKLSGGKRSESGVAAQETLRSVIRTCRKLIFDPFEYLRKALTSTTPSHSSSPWGGNQVPSCCLFVRLVKWPVQIPIGDRSSIRMDKRAGLALVRETSYLPISASLGWTGRLPSWRGTPCCSPSSCPAHHADDRIRPINEASFSQISERDIPK